MRQRRLQLVEGGADVRPAALVYVPGFFLDRVRGVEFDQLGERMLGSTSTQARLELVEQAFRPVLEGGTCQDRRCRGVLEMVDALDGQITVEGLGREFALSTRTIRRMVLDQVGLTPKQFIRNVRLQRTVARLRNPRLAGCQADLATACGFADQSHLIKEFHQLTGRLPSSF